MDGTPAKIIQEKEVGETGVKPEEESQYEPQESYDKVYTTDETLAHIEGQIEKLGERLKDIKEEKRGLKAGSPELEKLEDERRVLRKEIIDLDYHHQHTILERKRENEERKKDKIVDRGVPPPERH